MPEQVAAPRWLAAVVLVAACGGGSPRPLRNTAAAGPDDPILRLARLEPAMCGCVERQGSTIDMVDPGSAEGELADCVSKAAVPVNAWIGDDVGWRRGLSAAQVARATELLDRIRRCFQVGVGDPLPPVVGTKGTTRRQLWVTAIDTTKLGTGVDPSLPPYWLPDQDVKTENMSAFWSVPPPPLQ
jgi:hypothetical protein